MSTTFPGESAEYRAARDRLLEQEIELRRAMEAVAAARRKLPPGGACPGGLRLPGGRSRPHPGRREVVGAVCAGQGLARDLQLYVSARVTATSGQVPRPVKRRFSRSRRARARPVQPSSTSSRAPRSTSSSGSTSQSLRRRRCRASSTLPTSVAGGACAFSLRPPTPTTATTSARRQTDRRCRC